MRILKEKVNKMPNAKVVDYGSCVLHVGHNAFSKGLKVGANLVNTALLAKSVYGFFKYSTIRREDFAAELIDLEKEEKNFIRHVDSRWLSLKPSLERVDEQFEAIENYFLKTVNEKADAGDKNYKDAQKTEYYGMAVGQLRRPECRFMIKQVIYICEKFGPFMHKMQSSGPQIGFLYADCSRLLLDVLSCFLESSVLKDDMEAKDLIKLDLSKSNKDVPKMSPSADACYKRLSKTCQKNAASTVVKMLATTAGYMQRELHPLKSKLVRNLRVLDPKKSASLTDGGASAIVESAKEFARFSDTEMDRLALQWNALVLAKFTLQKKQRLDDFYSQCLRSLRCNDDQYLELGKFLKMALCLPSGNASVERG